MKNSKDKNVVVLTADEHKRLHESGLTLDAWVANENIRLREEGRKKADAILNYQETNGYILRKFWASRAGSFCFGSGFGILLSVSIIFFYRYV